MFDMAGMIVFEKVDGPIQLDSHNSSISGSNCNRFITAHDMEDYYYILMSDPEEYYNNCAFQVEQRQVSNHYRCLATVESTIVKASLRMLYNDTHFIKPIMIHITWSDDI